MKWYFPSNNNGEIQGLNDAGIEVFKDNPIKSLAREICQNSLDAHISDEKVIVEFKTFNVLSEEFPEKNEFNEILERCKDIGVNDKDKEVEGFFNNAIKALNCKTISMLRISDFNTKGLCEQDWNNLIVKSGSSAKKNSEGGRFGIGKKAPFACSNFRTVFYNTFAKDNEEKFEGVSRLISHKIGIRNDGSDDLSQGTGYYAEQSGETFTFSKKMIILDKSFNRNQYGTDIYIPSLIINDFEELKQSIIVEVLDSFLYSIYINKLEVNINGVIINKDSLGEIINTYSAILNDNTIMCYQLLNDDTVEWNPISIKLAGKELGVIKFGFKITDKGTNKVTMIRKMGMKIFDKTGLCSSLRFVGIAIIEGEALNKFLHDIEDISHVKWAPNRYSNPQIAKQLINDIFNALKDKLKEKAALYEEGEIDIVGASDYLPDEPDEESKSEKKSDNQTEHDEKDNILSVETRVIKKVKSVAHLETDEIGDDILSTTETDGSAGQGEGFEAIEHQGHKKHGVGDRETTSVGNDGGTDSIEKDILVKAKNIRIICINKKENRYRVVFTPNESFDKAYIEIEKISETNNETMPLNIVSAVDPSLTVVKNTIRFFQLQYGITNVIDFTIEDKEYSTMGVKIHAYKK